MKRIFITGMSGTGKSTVIKALVARGYKAIDAGDDGWSEMRELPGGAEWLWREDRIEELLSTEDAGVLFLGGCASNQVLFRPRFDEIVLLAAPAEILIRRLASRTTNSYGKHPDELADVLENLRNVEPLLRRVASLEIDSTLPLEEVVGMIESLVGGPTLRSD